MGLLREVPPRLLWLACVAGFALMALDQVDVFRREPTGSALARMELEALPFPAVSLCDAHFQQRRAFRELGMGRFSPFGGDPYRGIKEVTANPMDLYDKLDIFGHDVMAAVWAYYFTLDQVVDLTASGGCAVGGISCGLRPGDDAAGIVGSAGSQVAEVAVPAGRWVSRLLADSHRGSTFLCHTLVPNVTADFAIAGRSHLAFSWRKYIVTETYNCSERGDLNPGAAGLCINNTFHSSYPTNSTDWRVYVHDPREAVQLLTWAMGSSTSVPMTRVDVHDESHFMSVKRKLQLRPRLTRKPPPSAALPCRGEGSYSRNWCDVEWGWERRILELEEARGRDNVTCQLPGVWPGPGVRARPVCSRFESGVGRGGEYHTGFESLMDNIDKDPGWVGMTSPPLGVYRPSSPCPPRCETFEYGLLDEPVTEGDEDVYKNDFYLYFGSPEVEVWAEYRLVSLTDALVGIGGAVGLMLGMSVFSVIAEAAGAIAKALSAFKAGRSRGKKPPKGTIKLSAGQGFR